MTLLTRRSVLATGAAGAALGLSQAHAAAPLMGSWRPTYRRVKLGAFEVTTLLDGAAPVPNPQGIFGQDQSVETVEGLLSANNLPTDMMEFTFLPTVVNTGSELILFDTGNGAGAQPARGNLLTAMEAAGYSADQVDVVVITHMHPDHIGGMMTDGAPTFPNARYVMGATEYDFWNASERVGTGAEGIHTMVRNMLTPMAERTTFIQPGDSVVSGIEAMAAFGHTPGHMVYHIESEGSRVVLTADAANHFVLSLQRPDWEVRFDMDKAAAAQTRKDLFGMLAADGVPFIGYHMPYPAMGFVEAAGEGFDYTPVSYQLNL
jgi:glyoxylase-like metal-dependent hydrolase (beta-lactamase superfamily II)